MKTQTDHDDLLNEVFAESAPADFRAASLERTLAAARRQRRLRNTLRVTVAAAAGALLLFALSGRDRTGSALPIVANNSHPEVIQPAIKTVPGTNIRLVSDEELLAMFPDRPVALVGPPEARRFVFLDEQRNTKSHTASGRGLNL